jgi:hypothetical protein
LKDSIAKELDEILDAFREDAKMQKSKTDEEKAREFLARFEQSKVKGIRPLMEAIGRYLEAKGHAYQIKDDSSIYDDNPSIKLEIYPRSPHATTQEREFPKIIFVAEPDIEEVGIEVQDGMPGRPGLSRGHAASLESLTQEYVRDQILYLIRRNFSTRAK